MINQINHQINYLLFLFETRTRTRTRIKTITRNLKVNIKYMSEKYPKFPRTAIITGSTG